MLLALLCSCSESRSQRTDAGPGQDGDERLDGGDLLERDADEDGEEESIIVGDCVFPSPPRLKHELENEAGTRIEAWDSRLLCTLGRNELAGYTLVIIEPFDIVWQDIQEQAKAAFVCRSGEVFKLPQEDYYYQSHHHNWDDMAVAFDNIMYSYGWEEENPGQQPTHPFDIVNILNRSDGSTIESGLPATCQSL